MSTKSNKPPDPFLEEFCELTGMVVDKVHPIQVGNLKEVGKARNSNESSPIDNRGVKVTALFCNDGSFIKFPLDNCPIIDNQSNSMAKSNGPMTGVVFSRMGNVGISNGNQSSLLDGITIARTYIVLKEGMAGPRSRS
nr:hypothetical protein [Tanacetum cinerariifolium]GFB10052.1 hypothetical protein [Tanacetum cinerariifolium]